MKLSKLLKRNRKSAPLANKEKLFYLSNKKILRGYKAFKGYRLAKTSFEIIKSNIIIRSLLNLDEIKKNKKVDGFLFNDVFIGVPIYSPAWNILLNEGNCSFLLDKKDSSLIIDSFDTYGINLFQSCFTSLKTISVFNNLLAAYNEENKTLYIINDQGRLDLELPLFDKYLPNENLDNLYDRLLEIAKAYFEGDYLSLIDSLFVNGFISKKIYDLAKEGK